MRVIDADALYHLLPIDRYGHINTTITKLNIAEEKCKVDAVPVVRCKDCKWHEDDEFCQVLQWERGMFYHTNIWTMTDDDYCSRGERKDEVEE